MRENERERGRGKREKRWKERGTYRDMERRGERKRGKKKESESKRETEAEIAERQQVIRETKVSLGEVTDTAGNTIRGQFNREATVTKKQ